MLLLSAAAALVLLPAAAGIAAVLALFFLGETGPLLPASLGAAGLVLAALLVPLTGAGLRAHAARRAGHRLLALAQDVGADLPPYVLWIPGLSLLPQPPADASAHLHLAVAQAADVTPPPATPPNWTRLSRRVLAAHPRGADASHGILRLPDAPRLVRALRRPDGTLLLLDGP